jgi:hypothetical protein
VTRIVGRLLICIAAATGLAGQAEAACVPPDLSSALASALPATDVVNRYDIWWWGYLNPGAASLAGVAAEQPLPAFAGDGRPAEFSARPESPDGLSALPDSSGPPGGGKIISAAVATDHSTVNGGAPGRSGVDLVPGALLADDEAQAPPRHRSGLFRPPRNGR